MRHCLSPRVPPLSIVRDESDPTPDIWLSCRHQLADCDQDFRDYPDVANCDIKMSCSTQVRRKMNSAAKDRQRDVSQASS